MAGGATRTEAMHQQVNTGAGAVQIGQAGDVTIFPTLEPQAASEAARQKEFARDTSIRCDRNEREHIERLLNTGKISVHLIRWARHFGALRWRAQQLDYVVAQRRADLALAWGTLAVLTPMLVGFWAYVILASETTGAVQRMLMIIAAGLAYVGLSWWVLFITVWQQHTAAKVVAVQRELGGQ